jgi:iron(III) transport system ATP-binding protein
MPTVALNIENLHKTYETDQGPVFAINDVSFQVPEGSFFTLLGPSGCGKSTTLRCIAGLERPDSGEISLQGQSLVSSLNPAWVPPHKRPMGMVFQSYAIWPHMNVFDNVAFPLKQGPVKYSAQDIRSRVSNSLAMVHLDGLEQRPAPQLSGGQQQRLALARALVNAPQALLLDEPLSNLDAKLREQMRVELKQLTRNIGITTIFVTHDQEEALTLSDHIAIMDSGKLVQFGSPKEIYNAPENRFAAEFVGSANFIDGIVKAKAKAGQTVTVETPFGDFLSTAGSNLDAKASVAIAIRPENIELSTAKPKAEQSDNILSGRLENIVFLGDVLDCHVRVGEALVQANVHPTAELSEGTEVYLSIPKSASRVVPPWDASGD